MQAALEPKLSYFLIENFVFVLTRVDYLPRLYVPVGFDGFSRST